MDSDFEYQGLAFCKPGIHIGESLSLENANLVIQTDGGLCEDDCAAAAWIIGLWGIVGQACCYQPLIAHGTLLDPGCSVFAAEAIALDEASAEVQRLLRNMKPSM